MTHQPARPFTSLEDLRQRLVSTDLIPSQQPLLDDIGERFALLAQCGITSISQLQARLRRRGDVDSVAAEAGVDADYLVLLRRALGGFLPKPRSLRSFDHVDPDVVLALEQFGVKNSQQLVDAVAGGTEELARRTGVSNAELSVLATVSDLVRVQWVNPSFARALVEAGFVDPSSIAAADPDDLAEALATANASGRFYKGTVGRRDISRLIDAAAYVA